MKKETYLHIADPCHESWNDMTPDQQGRFCGSCCKTVVDFSQMSDKQILQMLSKAAGKTCGRFTEEQMQRPLYEEKPVMSKPYKLFLAALIPTFLLANSGMAQQKAVHKKAKQQSEQTIKEGIKGKVATKPLNAKPRTKNFDSTSLDIPVSTNIEERKMILGMVRPFVKPCTEDTTISIVEASPLKADKTVIPGLPFAAIGDQLVGRLGGVEIYSKVTAVDTIKTIVRKTFNQHAFKVFANPANTGGEIKVQFKEAGTYTIQLLDASGRMYLSQEVVVNSSKQPVVIKLPTNAIAGNYFIRAIDNNKKKNYVEKLVVR